jgi:hypothetical protein
MLLIVYLQSSHLKICYIIPITSNYGRVNMSVAAINTDLIDSIPSKKRFASVSSDPQSLADIYHDECNMAVWERDLPTAFLTKLADDLSQSINKRGPAIPNVNTQVRAKMIQHDIASIANDKSYGEQLRTYIADTIDMFCILFDADKVGLRLSVLDKAMCPRFHIDRVPCRLVTTFCGQGTQWVAHEHVRREKLGHGSGGKPDEESGLLDLASSIEQLSCGDVALLKGDIWEGNEGAALVHRSPPLVTGEVRLLMTIDFVD